MLFDFSKYELPAIYVRQGRECYLDPVREKLIYITPEETVRQQVLSYITRELQVPKTMIRVEERVSKYGVNSNRRVDILVHMYDEEQKAIVPLCVIECKAPTIMLGEATGNQLLDYADALLCDYAMMTNGREMLCYHYCKETNRYDMIEELPEYIRQLSGEYVPAPKEEIPPRLKHEEIPKNWQAYDMEIGKDTPKEICVPLTNFWECLLYSEHSFPLGKYKIFNVVDDMGLRVLSYGNASGGLFQGVYKSFLIEYKGSTEIVSIGVSPYNTDAKPDLERTAISVAIDTEDSAHHSLQLVVDDNLSVVGNKVTFYHHGRIGVSNKGSGKVAELRAYVEDMYPEIIDGNRFNLGTLVDDRLWTLDDKEVVAFIENMISYALVRDEYRAYIKKNR